MRRGTRARAAALACTCALGFGALSGPAGADTFHYNSELLGARAGGLGGAVVGMPEDDASGYYNPAAFLRGDQVKASVSATALDVQSLTYLQYLGAPATATSVNIIPNAGVASSPWKGGRVSFSVFTTDASQLVLNRSVVPSGYVVDTVRQTQDLSTYLLGPSIGVPLSSTLSVGVSIFFVYGSQSVLEQVYQVQQGSFAAAEHTIDSSETSTGVVVVAGMQYQPQGPAGRFTFGLAVRSGASLADQANRQDQLLTGVAPDAGPLIGTNVSTPSSAQGQGGIPSQISLGGSMRLGTGRIAAQATAYANQEYTDLGVPVNKRVTFNGGAGYEWTLGAAWTGRVGLYTDRSSAPPVTSVTATTEPHIDYYGATLGLTELEPHHTVDVALKFAYGYGQAIVDGEDGTAQSTGVRGYDLTLTIGGSFRLW